MAKSRFFGISGEKRGILLPILYYTTYYPIPFLLHSPISFQNLTPSSSRESLGTAKTPDSLCHSIGFARIRGVIQSLSERNPKTLFKGKSTKGRAKCGESKVQPHCMQKGFEASKAFHRIDSYICIKKPLKVRRNEGLVKTGLKGDGEWK